MIRNGWYLLTECTYENSKRRILFCDFARCAPARAHRDSSRRARAGARRAARDDDARRARGRSGIISRARTRCDAIAIARGDARARRADVASRTRARGRGRSARSARRDASRDARSRRSRASTRASVLVSRVARRATPIAIAIASRRARMRRIRLRPIPPRRHTAHHQNSRARARSTPRARARTTATPSRARSIDDAIVIARHRAIAAPRAPSRRRARARASARHARGGEIFYRPVVTRRPRRGRRARNAPLAALVRAPHASRDRGSSLRSHRRLRSYSPPRVFRAIGRARVARASRRAGFVDGNRVANDANDRDSRGRARGAARRMASRFREGTIKRACYDALRAAGEQGLTVRARGDDGGIPARARDRASSLTRAGAHTDRDVDAPRRRRTRD